MKLKKYIFFFLKSFKKKSGSDTFSIVSCSIRDPSPQDFSLMTLKLENGHFYWGLNRVKIFENLVKIFENLVETLMQIC
jgi:hypothetical protein